MELQTEETVEANALYRLEATPGSGQPKELSRQVQRLSAELAQLWTDSEHHQKAHERSKPSERVPCVEIATNEGIFEKIAPAKGLLIEHVSLRLPTQQVAWLMKLLFLWRAALERDRPRCW